MAARTAAISVIAGQFLGAVSGGAAQQGVGRDRRPPRVSVACPNENHALQVQTVILFFGGGATSATSADPRVTRMLDHLRTVGGTLPICGKSSSVTRGFLDEDGN